VRRWRTTQLGSSSVCGPVNGSPSEAAADDPQAAWAPRALARSAAHSVALSRPFRSRGRRPGQLRDRAAVGIGNPSAASYYVVGIIKSPERRNELAKLRAEIEEMNRKLSVRVEGVCYASAPSRIQISDDALLFRLSSPRRAPVHVRSRGQCWNGQETTGTPRPESRRTSQRITDGSQRVPSDEAKPTRSC
jgi:hypothetical protein